ncbi:ABC transporter G family member 23 [Silene latifolia]|uniref:ABC transporter G family member 23 n=1 Tax=Silene latifolia TaxID=37657 RepID=UPI003D78464E
MTTCFKQPITEDDSIILFSTSDSNEESGCSSSSSSSSSRRHSPTPPEPHQHQHPNTTYKLSVKNLSYTLHQNGPLLFKKPKQKIEILKSISFVAQNSQMLAIVGPSGTGKSTLLRIISGRVKDEEFSPNSILINNSPIKSPAQLRTLCGYVAQEDDLLPLLTVKETLMFRAKFRLRHLNDQERENKVNGLLHDLGLVQVANSYIGDDENRGISGGERKRVSIGVELIHDPPILLLDEPTSGLDSSSALQVIELLSSMTAKSKGRTIVFSIHQPSYRMIKHISNFLILSHGLVVHNGSIELLEERISRMGYEIPMQLNGLEFAMEIITKLEEQSCTLHNPQEQDKLITSSCTIITQNDESIGGANDDKSIKRFFLYWVLEIMILCSRFWKIIYRTKQLFLARTMQAIVGGLGLGSVYMKLGKDESGVGERLGLFAFSLSFLLSSTVEALPIYLQERKVIMKESSRGAYKVSSYMIANTLIFLPFLLVVALLFSAPVYWIVGLNPSFQAFAFFVFIVWLIVLMASSLVLFLSAISPDFIAGNSLICTVLGAFFLFSGYFIPKENIPKYWVFMYYVSLYRYPLDSLLVNEYWSMRDDCFSWVDNKCLMYGKDVLQSRGLEKDTRWANVGIMIGFFLLYRVICWVILARRAAKTTL